MEVLWSWAPNLQSTSAVEVKAGATRQGACTTARHGSLGRSATIHVQLLDGLGRAGDFSTPRDRTSNKLQFIIECSQVRKLILLLLKFHALSYCISWR